MIIKNLSGVNTAQSAGGTGVKRRVSKFVFMELILRNRQKIKI